MEAHNHNNCTAGCATEFAVCVTEGWGYDTCLVELAQGSVPLAGPENPCRMGCTPTAAMTALGSVAHPCTEGCASEFVACVWHGPGFSTCVEEIRNATEPLAFACASSCVLTQAMLDQQPSANTCSSACANEFGACVNHWTPGMSTAAACLQCRQEIDTQSVEQLAEVCNANCLNHPSMAALCDPSASTTG